MYTVDILFHSDSKCDEINVLILRYEHNISLCGISDSEYNSEEYSLYLVSNGMLVNHEPTYTDSLVQHIEPNEHLILFVG